MNYCSQCGEEKQNRPQWQCRCGINRRVLLYSGDRQRNSKGQERAHYAICPFCKEANFVVIDLSGYLAFDSDSQCVHSLRIENEGMCGAAILFREKKEPR